MKNRILAIVLMLSMTLMLVMTPVASSAGIPNPDTITYASIGGPDATGGSDPAWAYDTASSEMIMQVYEPLFMYLNMSLISFQPLLADWWNGYTGDGYTPGGFIVPLHPSNATELAQINSYGIYPPEGAAEVWVFHIRENVPWQNPAYGTVKPSDLVYSIQRGLLQDAISTVQWMMYGPLLGVADSTHWFNQTGDGTWNYNGTTGLGTAVKGVVQGNDVTGYVAFMLPAPYVPFMQILTQSWAMVTSKEWCIDMGCIDTDIALSNNPNNFTEFLDNYQPKVSPLMKPSVVGSEWPMMGTGPYILKVFNTDPHTGFQRFQRFVNYWQGWGANYAEYVVIKIVEEWANRKFQFLSTSSTQADLTDVPRANCAELHVSGKDSATLPGIRLVKVLRQVADYYFYNYHIGAGSAFFPKWGNGTEEPYLFSDRNLRIAMMYCFNDSKFLHEYWLDEATQPSTFMCDGTAFYNGSVPVRQSNFDKAVEYFKKAWGGQVWSKGITVKLVYNIGNTARQTIATMISDFVSRINDAYPANATHKLLHIEPDGEPWATYLPAMQAHQLSCFTVGWAADYPDPDDWAYPFMASGGAFSGAGQSITYGLDTTGLSQEFANAVPKLTWGGSGLPYTGSLGDIVTGLNNSYVDNLIMTATGLPADMREKVYNELMDIYYAEAASLPTDQGIGRHYERDWIHGWVGGYSNNPVAFGPFFYQMWKALPTPATPVYGVYLNARDSIMNTSNVYSSNVLPLAGAVKWTVINSTVTITFDCTAKYENLTGASPIIVTFGLKRFNPLTGEILYVDSATFTMILGQTLTESFTWNETDENGALNGVWVIAFRAEPVGVAGGVVFPTNEAKLEISWPLMGDLGTGPPPTFYAYDGAVDAFDYALWKACYDETPPYSVQHCLGDLGTGPPPTFYAYDGAVDAFDYALWKACYDGLGP
jgi:peptide/nickel transport system substrate-binding protein